MRDQLTAAFIACHLVAITVLAIPAPLVAEDKVDDPKVQAWFDRTTDTLHRWGVPASRETVEEVGVQLGRAWLDARGAVGWPASRYATWTGAKQSWRMFGTVPDKSAYLRIEVDRGEGWELLHVSRSEEHAWRKELFDNERTRTFVNQFAWKRNRGAWKRCERWLEVAIAEDDPDVDRFRMSMVPVHFPDPEVLAVSGTLPEGNPFWSQIVRIGEAE